MAFKVPNKAEKKKTTAKQTPSPKSLRKMDIYTFAQVCEYVCVCVCTNAIHMEHAEELKKTKQNNENKQNNKCKHLHTLILKSIPDTHTCVNSLKRTFRCFLFSFGRNLKRTKFSA